MSGQSMPDKIAIIGAGPAGLTAAYELAKHAQTGIIFESDEVVGGIARTVLWEGYRFDLGGHRFFTKSAEVLNLWDEIPVEPLLTRPRLSRIYYDNRFWDYPLKAKNALLNMGLGRSIKCLGSFTAAKIKPIKDPQSFEQWVINSFGYQLYTMFFRTYTEKVWGIPCSEISADWAAQRIRSLDLWEVIRNALFGQRKGNTVTTLIEEFKYPRLGPGQLWQDCADKVCARGWDLQYRTRVTSINLQDGAVSGVEIQDAAGNQTTVPVTQVLSSMPIRELIQAFGDVVPEAVRQAAEELRYRDFMLVALVLATADAFPDNWIYIHSPDVKLGRVQNFRNWSPDLVPDLNTTCLGLEYFCNEGDELWTSPDEALINLGYSELKQLGLANGDLIKGHVVRVPKAYPVYNEGYAQRLETIRQWLGSIKGLQCIGRNGQHRYNNMDHSMMTAILAARNIANGSQLDPWAVNEDAEYHEVDKSSES